MCKAHSKVTHIKQQNYFHHLKGHGYNKNSVFYPGRFRWWNYFCCFICVTLLWALHIVIKQQFYHINLTLALTKQQTVINVEMILRSTLCPKKSSTPNSWQQRCQFLTDFQNSSLLERQVNFQQNSYNTSHHTFSVLPHYLAKVRSSSFGISGRKCKRKCTMHWFLNTYPILMHLLAYLLTFRLLLNNLCNSLCKQQTILLSRVSTLTRDIDIAILTVCLSVRNAPVSDENGLT